MAHSIEEPRHEVVGAIGDVEIRHYEPSIQAVTTLSSSGQTTYGFQRLAGYIFGGNDGTEKIAMTAPVQETLSKVEPVMAFTMPAQYQLQDLPAPHDSRVSLVEVPARTVAVVSFSGWATPAKVKRYQRKLLKVLAGSQTQVLGLPVLNQYNPPWTLPFLRRNEIAVEIAVEIEQPVEVASRGRKDGRQDGIRVVSGLSYTF